MTRQPWKPGTASVIKQTEWVVGVALLWLAMATRVLNLGWQSLSQDEPFSHLFATLPFHILWKAMIVDAVHPPLYYLLLRPWVMLTGESEYALRFFSALIGVLTVALVLRVGPGWIGRGGARWSALLLAVNPFHVWYSQEARMYVLLGALGLATMAAFWQTLHRGRDDDWWLLGVCSALAYLTHYFALYLPLIEFVFILINLRRYHHRLVRWTLTQFLAALPLAGWLVALFVVGGDTFGIGWIRPSRLDDLLRTFWSFGMAYDGRFTWLVGVALVAWGVLIAIGLLRGGGQPRLAGFLGLWMVLPVLVTFLLSFRRPTYVDRFFITGLFPFLLLAGAGLARMPQWWRWGLGIGLTVLGAWGVGRFYADPLYAKADWRSLAAWVQSQERPGDGLMLCEYYYTLPFRYYYQGSLDIQSFAVNQQITPMDELVRGRQRMWLIVVRRKQDAHHLALSEPFDLEQDVSEPALYAWITAHPPDEIVDFPGLVVMRFDQPGGTP